MLRLTSLSAKIVVLSVAALAGLTPAWADDPVERRVEELLSKMTLEEKIDYIGGVRDMYIRPIERLGIPEIKMSDGPAGLRTHGKGTAYPAPITLAASFNTELAARFGASIGRDSRARGVHIWLGPGVDLARQPQCGRNFEYFGEDPLVVSRMAVEVIRAVQSQGVAATIKHFAANDQEADRHTVSSEVDERTLRELHLRAFEDGVRKAGVWAVMCGYNRLNGVHCSEHDWLLNQVLRQDWGFRGVLMSDWGSVCSTAGPVKNGLDLEMPSGKFMNRAAILPLIQDGSLSESLIDEKVRRILRMSIAMGFLDRPQKDESIPLDDPKSDAVALDVAREGIVLLKNENALLPLDRQKTRRIIVVGPNAHPAVTGGGGSSNVQPFHSISVVDALRAVAGETVEVVHLPALGAGDRLAFEFSDYLQPAPADGPGLKAEYFANRELKGEPAHTRTETKINYYWEDDPPAPGVPGTEYSVRWSGRLRPSQTTEYTAVARSDDGMRVFLDGKQIIDMWRDQSVTSAKQKIRLEAGRTYDLRVEYYQGPGAAIVQFGLIPNADGLVAQQLSDPVFDKADAVVACVGFDADSESEGLDRPFDLPPEQETLLRALVERCPKTIVVMNSGAGVNMLGWIDNTPAVVQAWYPGQNGNTALAEILFGVTNPSGRLPTTFERRFADSYAKEGYPPPKDGKLVYHEGVLLGYRWFDAKQIEPLFCFGHGLSYTTFEVGGLEIKPGKGALAASVSAWVENTGSREGAATIQLYVHAPDGVLRAPRELKGFQKVNLAPGERKSVSFELERAALAYYDVAARRWTAPAGQYEILVGRSSRDLPVRGKLELPAGE